MELKIGNSNVRSLTPLQALAIGSLFILGGVAIAGYGFIQHQGQKQSIDQAVNVTASITDTHIEKQSSRRDVEYLAQVDFQYTYKGKNYSSSFYYPFEEGKEFDIRSNAESFLQKYNDGDRINAYLNPEKPGKAFLKAETSGDSLLIIGIGVFMALAGTYAVAVNTI